MKLIYINIVAQNNISTETNITVPLEVFIKHIDNTNTESVYRIPLMSYDQSKSLTPENEFKLGCTLNDFYNETSNLDYKTVITEIHNKLVQIESELNADNEIRIFGYNTINYALEVLNYHFRYCNLRKIVINPDRVINVADISKFLISKAGEKNLIELNPNKKISLTLSNIYRMFALNILHLNPRKVRESYYKIQTTTLGAMMEYNLILSIFKMAYKIYPMLTDGQQFNSDSYKQIVEHNKPNYELFPFGKHKDKLIVDVFREDPDYIYWALSKTQELEQKYGREFITKMRYVVDSSSRMDK